MAVIKFNFLSHVLGIQQNLTIIIPTFSFDDLDSDREEVYVPGMNFQTLYLHHGSVGDDSDWVNLTSIVRYANANKLAVVMPAGNNSFYTNMAHGGDYFTYISEEVPKVCRTVFPLSDKREDNFVAGLSMGGYGAMSLAIKRPDMFSAAVCLSGAALTIEDIIERANRFSKEEQTQRKIRVPRINMANVFGDFDKFPGSENDIYHIAKKNVEEGKQLPEFFFACGDKDFVLNNVRKAKDYLGDLGYKVSYEEVPGYGHEWDFWDLYIRKAIYEWLPLKRSAIYPDEE